MYSGLCASCVHSRLIRSGKGSVFTLCEKSRTDPRFPLYPPLPVLACIGYEPIADRAPSTPEDGEGEEGDPDEENADDEENGDSR